MRKWEIDRKSEIELIKQTYKEHSSVYQLSFNNYQDEFFFNEQTIFNPTTNFPPIFYIWLIMADSKSCLETVIAQDNN